jgi:hypothetical protein
MGLYVASDQPIAATAWSETKPGFHVQHVTEADDRVRVQFSKAHVMYLGAHTGCSCGFSYEMSEPESDEDRENNRLGRGSVEALRAFLWEQLAVMPEVELFSCWQGDEGAAPEARVRVTPDHFGGGEFDLPERVFYRVRRAAEQPDAADRAGKLGRGR